MEDELLLVEAIVSGDIDAWHWFVEEFTPYLRKTIGRYVKDHEVAHDLYVSLLEKLKKEKLKRFSGRSTLSTWLFIVARNHCRDYFRSSKGVRHILSALKDLDKLDRRFFELHYLQGFPIHEVLESLRLEMGKGISYMDLISCKERIKRKVAEKKLGKLLDRLLHPGQRAQLPSREEASYYPELQYLYKQVDPPPDTIMNGDAFGRALENLREALSKLPYKDQIILKLRFEHKASARRINEILDLGNEKQVYRRLERLFDKLKELLFESELPLEVYEEIVQNLDELKPWGEIWNSSARLN